MPNYAVSYTHPELGLTTQRFSNMRSALLHADYVNEDLRLSVEVRPTTDPSDCYRKASR